MSVAFFGIVRSKPQNEQRPVVAERRAGGFSEIWSRRLDKLAQLVETGSRHEYAYAEGSR